MTTKDKYHFLGKPAPVGYVAGVGRGASGFITRSDIGPAIIPQQDPLEINRDEEENDAGLLSSVPGYYDAEDAEADKIYSLIDSRIKPKSKTQTDKGQPSSSSSSLSIRSQFEDLKRGISVLTESDWANIPEVGDLTAVRPTSSKKAKSFLHRDEEVHDPSERYTPISDFFIERGARSVLQPLKTPEDGIMTDFSSIGAARERQLGLAIDSAASTEDTAKVSGNIEAYLTGLQTLPLKTSTEVRDLSRAKMLLSVLVRSNQTSIPAWLSLIRLHEGADELDEARLQVQRALKFNPSSEDLWLESSRLASTPEIRLEILEKALKILPRSIRLWIRAADAAAALASSPIEGLRQRLDRLREALTLIRDSQELWREGINASRALDQSISENSFSLETRLLLEQATTSLPSVPEFWIGLAEIQQNQEASRTVLNKARTAAPLSFEIWVASACIEETKYNNEAIVPTLLNRMKKVLADRSIPLSSEVAIKMAMECEISKAPVTAENLILLGYSYPSSQATTVTEEAERLANQGYLVCGRSVFLSALKSHPHDEELWMAAVSWERQHCSTLPFKLLPMAMAAIPTTEQFWLMAAKDAWRASRIEEARTLLKEAFVHCPDSEELWIAAAKIEVSQGDLDQGRDFLRKGRLAVPGSARIIIKSAQLERAAGQLSDALVILQEATKAKIMDFRLWLMLAETLLLSNTNTTCNDHSVQVKALLSEGLRLFPKEAPMWITASKFERLCGTTLKTRAILEHGRAAISRSDTVWAASIEFELELKNIAIARGLLARALQAIPTSGLLWRLAVRMEPRAARKTKAADALKRCPEDPLLALELARIFWEENLYKEKIFSWIERAIALDPKLGDAHAYAILFERTFQSTPYGSAYQRCCDVEPKFGDLWISVSKDPQLILGSKHLALPTALILERVVEKVAVLLNISVPSHP